MSWVTKVLDKIRNIRITTLKGAVLESMRINQKLRMAGLKPMHRQTLDLVTKMGIAIIAGPNTPSLPAPDTPLSSSDDGKCPECNDLGPLGLPGTTDQCKEEGATYRPIENWDLSDVGNCPASSTSVIMSL